MSERFVAGWDDDFRGRLFEPLLRDRVGRIDGETILPFGPVGLQPLDSPSLRPDDAAHHAKGLGRASRAGRGRRSPTSSRCGRMRSSPHVRAGCRTRRAGFSVTS